MRNKSKYLIQLFLLSILNAINVLQAQDTATTKVVFEDTFDQESRIPDAAKWSLCQSNTSNWAKYLSMSNDQAYIENGKLIVKAEKVGGVYKTGGITTKGKFDFLYCKIEVNAKFIMAKGVWPAIWMMPTNSSAGWPACGEIDIMEQLNYDNFVYQTIHNKYKNTLGYNTPTSTKTSYYNVNQFNTYALEWSTEGMIFSVNGIVSFTYPNLHLTDEAIKGQWPYNKEFYLILNCSLGGVGTWPGVINDSELPASMQVDWVKVTQKLPSAVQKITNVSNRITVNQGKLLIQNTKINEKVSVFNQLGQIITSKIMIESKGSIDLKQSDKIFIVQLEEYDGTKNTYKLINK